MDSPDNLTFSSSPEIPSLNGFADMTKMFIGGISWNTSEGTLKEYFSVFGDVQECCVMRDPLTRRSRGFGFVKFANPDTVDEVLCHSEAHVIDGKKVDPKKAVPKNQSKMVNRTKKVFLGGLPPDTTNEDVKAYFRNYGEVEEVMLMYDKATQRLRGFGFVKFLKEDAADRACLERYHEIKGKMVEAKKAQPKEVMTTIKAREPLGSDSSLYQSTLLGTGRIPFAGLYPSMLTSQFPSSPTYPIRDRHTPTSFPFMESMIPMSTTPTRHSTMSPHSPLDLRAHEFISCLQQPTQQVVQPPSFSPAVAAPFRLTSPPPFDLYADLPANLATSPPSSNFPFPPNFSQHHTQMMTAFGGGPYI